MDNQVNETQPIQERIIYAASKYYGVSPSEIKGPPTTREATYRKRVCLFLMKENTRMSFQSMSAFLNYKNKKSAFTAVEEIRTHKNIYKQTANDIKNISSIALL